MLFTSKETPQYFTAHNLEIFLVQVLQDTCPDSLQNDAGLSRAKSQMCKALKSSSLTPTTTTTVTGVLVNAPGTPHASVDTP